LQGVVVDGHVAQAAALEGRIGELDPIETEAAPWVAHDGIKTPFAFRPCFIA